MTPNATTLDRIRTKGYWEVAVRPEPFHVD